MSLSISPILARHLKLRHIQAASSTQLHDYIEDWRKGTDPHPDGGDVGGGEKKVLGIVYKDDWLEATIYYSD